MVLLRLPAPEILNPALPALWPLGDLACRISGCGLLTLRQLRPPHVEPNGPCAPADGGLSSPTLADQGLAVGAKQLKASRSSTG
mmetsp:Transcript_6033/g.9618  ORF Transcript_6033/g.9618 Transcript_6033/m.9618 type:complete len:84 (-) Transcript_6033:107-358(-)